MNSLLSSPDRKLHILVYVEDPGAANYVAALPDLARTEGWSLRLYAAGAAFDYMRDRGLEPVSFPAGEHPAAMIRREAPSLLVVGTSENTRTPAHELVHAARTDGVPVVGVVDAFANASHRFRGEADSPLAHAPECLVVPDDWTRQAYIDLGATPASVIVCGHPQYDRVRTEAAQLRSRDRAKMRRELFPGLAVEQSVVLFAAELSTGLNPDQFRLSRDYTLHGRGGAEGRTEIVLEELLDAVATLDERPFIALRPHPKNRLTEFESYLAEIDCVSSEGSPLEVVYAADLVVGMTTMLLLEAAILGVPTLSIVPREIEREWLPNLRLGVTRCVTTREEVRRELPLLLEASKAGRARGDADFVLYGSAERLRRVIAERLGVRKVAS